MQQRPVEDRRRPELGSVATWLRTHAFTVVAARERLLGPRHPSGR